MMGSACLRPSLRTAASCLYRRGPARAGRQNSRTRCRQHRDFPRAFRNRYRRIYAAAGEGIGKAGGYAIQGHAAAYIRFISGSLVQHRRLCRCSTSRKCCAASAEAFLWPAAPSVCFMPGRGSAFRPAQTMKRMRRATAHARRFTASPRVNASRKSTASRSFASSAAVLACCAILSKKIRKAYYRRAMDLHPDRNL